MGLLIFESGQRIMELDFIIFNLQHPKKPQNEVQSEKNKLSHC